MSAIRAAGPVVGRSTERARLTALLDRITAGGDALVVRGEPGIGKSTLVQETMAVARDRGIVVLTTSGVQSETRLGFAGLHQLLRPVRKRADALGLTHQAALNAAFGLVDEPNPAPFKIAMAALELLCEVAAETPLLIAVDDAHWLDRPSADVLAFVARRVQSDPIVLLAASRDGYGSPFVDAGLPELRLGPLSPETAGELLDRGPSLGTASRNRILREAAGNPLALIELPETIARADEGEVLPLTERLELAFAARVADLPERTQRLLLVAATHDGDDLGEVLAAGGALDALTVEDLQPAVDVAIVELDMRTVRFRHSLVRSAVRNNAPVAQRRQVHAALAELLAAEPARAIWHRAALVSGPDEALAALLEREGEGARGRGAIGVAAAAHRRAAQLSEPPERNRRRLMAAQLAHELGRRDIALELLREVEADAPTPIEHARATWIAEMVDPRPLGNAERVGGLLTAAREAGAAGDRQLQLDLVWLVAQRAWWVDPGPAARVLLIDAARALGDAGDENPQIVAIHAYADPFGHAAAVAERLRTESPAEAARHLGPAATVASILDVGVALLGTAVHDLRMSGRLGFLARTLAIQALGTAWIADFDRAIPAAEEAHRLATELDDTLWTAGADVARSLIAGMRGDAATASEISARAEQTGYALNANFIVMLAQLGPIAAALADGRHADALPRLERLFDPTDMAYHPVMSTWNVSGYADAARHLGLVDEARARVAEIAERAGPRPGTWLELNLRHARALLAEDDEAEARFADALDPTLGVWPFQHALVRLAYGQWLRRQRRIADSRTPLRAARDAFDRVGCTGWANSARRELRASGESSRRRTPDARDQLTAQELQIAQLAAEGLSNREIAQRLYLSHRTVSTHLYRIFPKLGITARGGLAAALRTAG